MEELPKRLQGEDDEGEVESYEYQEEVVDKAIDELHLTRVNILILYQSY